MHITLYIGQVHTQAHIHIYIRIKHQEYRYRSCN